MKKKSTYSIKIPSSSEHLGEVDEICTKIVKKAGLSESECDDVAIAVTELVNNAIHHGNRNNKNKNVYITFSLNKNLLEVKIRDEGEGFNPKEIKNPLEPENLLKESGRGIFLIKELMDGFEFNFKDSGTEVIIKKNLPN